MKTTEEKAIAWADEAAREDNALLKSTAAEMATVYATLLVAERLAEMTNAIRWGAIA